MNHYLSLPQLRHLLFVKTDNAQIQFLRYFFVGGFAFLIDFGILYVLTYHFKVYYLVSATIAFAFGLTVNYILSVLWVFNKRTLHNKWIEFLIFTMIGVIGLGINDGILWIFTDVLAIHYLISKIFSTVIVYFWNFFARKMLLFGAKKQVRKIV